MNREQILKANTLRVESTTVPEWGDGPVYVRSMSGAERDAFEAENYHLSSAGTDAQALTRNLRARLLVRCLCDADRTLTFTTADADELGGQSGAILGRLYDLARVVNGMTDAAEASAVKN